MASDDELKAEAKQRAERMATQTLADRLNFYADDLESEGRTHAPACIREAARRLLLSVAVMLVAVVTACGSGDQFSTGAAGAPPNVAGHPSVAGSASAGGAAPAVAGAAGDAGVSSELGGARSVAGDGAAGEPLVGGSGGTAAGTGGTPAAGGGGGLGGGSTGGAGDGGGGASACTPFDASKPVIPARCTKVVGSCNPGTTCITLEQPYPSIQSPAYDGCLPSEVKTTCSACRETMTCACLARDFSPDGWTCCDTAAGPVYVLKNYYQCPPK